MTGRAETAWKWLLRLAGLGIALLEVFGEGRVSVLTLAAGMMGLPSVWLATQRSDRQ